MINETFEGVIKSISAKSITRHIDGEKVKESVYIMKLESDDIDYDNMTKFSSAISSTLLNIQPMPFDSVNFGDMSVMNMTLELQQIDDDTKISDSNKYDVLLHKVKIKNLTVKNRANIPLYIFTIQIPSESDVHFMMSNLKTVINFKFGN